MEIVENHWDENRDEKDRKAGCGFMKPYGSSPVSMLIGLSDDLKDAWKISPRTNTQKKEKNLKSLITSCPLKPKEDKGNPHMSKEKCSFVPPKGGKPSCSQKGEAIPYGEGGK